MIDSTNKKILIISDLHQEIDKTEAIISKEKADEVVVLGDYFDSFTHNSEKDLKKTCDFLWKYSGDNDEDFKITLLFGNHDLQYLFDNHTTLCSGYFEWKKEFVKNYLREKRAEIRKNLKWFIRIDNYLCSHAGIHSLFLSDYIDVSIDSVENQLTREAEDASVKLLSNQYHWFWGAGMARGGRQSVGGLLWLDWHQEFELINGLNQIVGHTHGKKVQKFESLDELSSENYNIDCGLKEYIVIENKKLKIKKS